MNQINTLRLDLFSTSFLFPQSHKFLTFLSHTPLFASILFSSFFLSLFYLLVFVLLPFFYFYIHSSLAMQLSSLLLAAAGLLAPVYSSAIITIGRRSEGLDVSLASIGNTKVQVSVTNTGSSEISVLKANTFFDKSPTKKANVYKEGMLRISPIYIYIYAAMNHHLRSKYHRLQKRSPIQRHSPPLQSLQSN